MKVSGPQIIIFSHFFLSNLNKINLTFLDGRNGLPGSAGSPGQCPNDCYYTQQLYMQQLQAAHAQQQTKGPSPLSLNIKG